ncbi:ATP-dependent RNA helicase DDX19B [Trichinella spiralis]|nr:ATP-dependent RNA helicase DDX19B [Trichinella spiralis]
MLAKLRQLTSRYRQRNDSEIQFYFNITFCEQDNKGFEYGSCILQLNS